MSSISVGDLFNPIYSLLWTVKTHGDFIIGTTNEGPSLCLKGFFMLVVMQIDKLIWLLMGGSLFAGQVNQVFVVLLQLRICTHCILTVPEVGPTSAYTRWEVRKHGVQVHSAQENISLSAYVLYTLWFKKIVCYWEKNSHFTSTTSMCIQRYYMHMLVQDIYKQCHHSLLDIWVILWFVLENVASMVFHSEALGNFGVRCLLIMVILFSG